MTETKIKYDDVKYRGFKIRFDADGAISQAQLKAMDDETLKFVRKVMNEFVERGIFEIVGLNEHGEPVYRGI
jgi:hypothetical protein